jgi:hypothetical protein
MTRRLSHLPCAFLSSAAHDCIRLARYGAGFDSIYLHTHEKMTENIALYSRIGYAEYDGRRQDGFSLVYMRKPLT